MNFKDHSLPKNLILKKKKEITSVLTNGKRISKKDFNTFIHNSEKTGVAFLISKKMGNAVKRNKMKRLMRELYRLNKDYFKGKEVIFFIKKYQDDFHQLKTQLDDVKDK